MLTYLPNSISKKAMTFYFVTLAVASVAFMSRILPFVWMLFGAVEVCAFFYFSNDLTRRWQRLHSKTFVKKLFWTALVIRLVYMVFVYFFYEAMTGEPFMFHTADEGAYYYGTMGWHYYGFEVYKEEMKYFLLEDLGELWFVGFLTWVFGPYVFTARIAHSILSALTCVLIYRIGKRHFGESTGRMAAIFCMLMPNLIYYCGIHLKEADMVFVVVFFVDCVDVLLCEKKFDFKRLVLVLALGFSLFTFRTVLGAVGLIAVLVAAVFNKGKLGSWWKRILLAVIVIVSLATTTVGDRLLREANKVWDDRTENQAVGMQARSKREGGNTFAMYATGTLFAPMIFTLPFPTLVNVDNQENQMMIHGGNFVKNVMSGFTIFALFLLLLSGEWRKHTLPIAMMCGYLAVIAFSNFAHSERFHQPALPFELLFAAVGISQLKGKQFKWVDYWLIFVMVANMGWSWIKLAGRGLA